MRARSSLQAISSVAVKEFIHIYRDWRILVLLLILPPVFTLIFGHAFEVTGSSNVPALLENRDQSPASEAFVKQLRDETTFRWKMANKISGHPNLLQEHVQAALIIPTGWGASLRNGDPVPLMLYLDGGDTNTATELEGRLQESLGVFQKKQLEATVESLPEEVIDLAKKLPVNVRKEFVSAMSQWSVQTKVLYNPEKRFIDYVVPGIIGIILQLLTVTLTACTIARERESGTLYQLMVTSLRRGEIVIGKILPYLAISIRAHSRHYRGGGLAFSRPIPPPFRPCPDLPPLPPLLVRDGSPYLRFFPHPNPGDPAFGFLLAPGLYFIRRLRSPRAVAAGDPLSLRMLPPDSFLPRLPPGESLPGRTELLRRRPSLPARRSARHVFWRCPPAQTNPGIA